MQLYGAEKKFGDYLEAHRSKNPGKPLEERTIQELRAGTDFFLQYAGDPAPVSFVDRSVCMRDGTRIAIRIYNNHLPENSPVFIYYPGCAFVFELSEINGIICSRIAAQSGIKVILVQFRLAPEHPMPISLYDGYDAAAYIAANPEEFGIDAGRIILGGWCSGAHCAAAVSSLARRSPHPKIFHQILMSGSYDLTESSHGFEAYEAQDKTLHRSFLKHVAGKYYGISSSQYKDPLFSPYHEKNFTGLPPTTILVGEFDALRNDSEAYFLKLKNNGIPVEKIVLSGQTHNTIAMRQSLSDGEDPAHVIAEKITACLDINFSQRM